MEGVGLTTTRVSVAGKVVLITGAAGFIGSFVVRRFLREGAQVHILAKSTTDLWRLRQVASQLTCWHANLTAYAQLEGCIVRCRPAIVIHLAGFRNAERRFDFVQPAVDANIGGTVNLLTALQRASDSIECVVNTGSGEEYGDNPVPFVERQRERPLSPYAASKVAVTHLCEMLHRTVGVPIVTLRPFSTYGPSQPTDRLVPSLIRHCLDGKDYLMTTGDQTREFNHVDDIADAYVRAACCPEAVGHVINIGCGREQTVRSLAEQIVAAMGHPIALRFDAIPKRTAEIGRFFCDNSKARTLLGWQPCIDLEAGINATIAWYKENAVCAPC